MVSLCPARQCINIRLPGVWTYTGIGRLRKSGGQKIDLISLLLNKFS